MTEQELGVVSVGPWIRWDDPSQAGRSVRRQRTSMVVSLLLEHIEKMGFRDGRVRLSAGENIEVREPSARSAPNSLAWRYLESLQFKLTWFTQTSRARIVTSSNRRYLFNLDTTSGSRSYISRPREDKEAHKWNEGSTMGQLLGVRGWGWKVSVCQAQGGRAPWWTV